MIKIVDNGKGNKINSSNNIESINFSLIINGDQNIIELGDGMYCRDTTIFISGNKHRFSADKGCHFDGVRFSFEDDSCSITIRESTHIYDGSKISALEPNKNIYIGKFCAISSDTSIRTSDSHSIYNSDGDRINYGEDIYIADNVWICESVKILKGSIINEQSVIGSGSIVTGKNYPPHSIIAGNPARVIKSGITWNYKRTYATE